MELSSLKIILNNKRENNKNVISEFNLLKKDKLLFITLCDTYPFIDSSNIGQLLYHLRDDLAIQTCICNKQLKFHKYDKGYFKTCGSKECISTVKQQSIKDTTLERYGVEHTSQLLSTHEKRKETMIKKYDCEHNFSGVLREKQYEKNIEKWGVKHPLQNKDIQDKRKTTIIERYGSLDLLHSDKSKKTNLIRYNTENPMQNKDIANKVSESLKITFSHRQIHKLHNWNIDIIEYKSDTQYYDILCKKCESRSLVPGSSMNAKLRSDSDPCVYCNPYIASYASKLEIEVYDYIVSLGEVVLNNVKTIVSKSELDIFLPQKNIRFEFNGLYWHSELHKHPTYHNEKSAKFLEKGVKIYHIWEDDWINKKEIVKRRIRNLLIKPNSIGARKCSIKFIDHSIADNFFNETHIDGNFSAKYYLGAYYNDELISCISFSKSRFDRADSWEIIRFSSTTYTVIGLCSKFIKFFKKNVDDTLPIITYAKTDWTPDPENNVYIKNGFELVSHTTPSPYWSINGDRFHRLNFTKKKLIAMGKNPDKTAVEIMHNDGYYRVYDSGNWKFILK